MRRILLALTALAFMMPAAEAARRDESGRQAASRPAQQAQTAPAQRGKATTQRTTRRAAPSRQQARAASTRRATLRPGDVRTSRSGVAMRGTAAARSGIAGWQAGLPRADYAQTECPDGTFATLARGHDDVVRCMPL
jgi:hypothetical protein